MEYYIKVEPTVKIYLEDINSASRKPILFLHGWPLNHKAYEYQYNALAARGYRCIGLDTRGFGRSDRPASGYSYNRLADDVKRIIDELNLMDVTLVGHSMGGAIATRYMSRHNGFGVSRLVLLGAAVPSITKLPDFPYGIDKSAVDTLIETTYTDRPKMLRDFNSMFFFQDASMPLQDWFFNLGLEAAGYSTALCAQTFRDETLFPDLSMIHVPTLIMHGVHDQVCRYPLAVYQNQMIKNSILIPFENSGHGLFWEEKDKLNQELMDFIEQ